MSSPIRNDCRIYNFYKSSGIALLVMMGVILIAFTATAIGRLSLNSFEQKNNSKTVVALSEARDAIMGFTLTRTSDALPPGSLPCPDRDGDGSSDLGPAVLGGCASQQGLVPFVTLGMAQSVGGVITPAQLPLWYVIPAGYGGNAVAPFNPPRNSSLPSPLMLNGRAMAFIVIAPGKLLGNQSPATTPLAAVSNFLEFPNNGADPNNTYSDLNDLTHNDKLLGMPIGNFWTIVSGRVLAEVNRLLDGYRTICGIYPWPVPYAPATGNNSNATLFEGRLPLDVGITLPRPWNSSCPLTTSTTSSPLLPTWLARHWRTELYYAICAPNSPDPLANCLELNGVAPVDARAIVMAPGIPLVNIPAQFGRIPGSPLSNYFENANNSQNDRIFSRLTQLQHTATFNDLISIVP